MWPVQAATRSPALLSPLGRWTSLADPEAVDHPLAAAAGAVDRKLIELPTLPRFVSLPRGRPERSISMAALDQHASGASTDRGTASEGVCMWPAVSLMHGSVSCAPLTHPLP